MAIYLIKDAWIVNRGEIKKGSVYIENKRIAKIYYGKPGTMSSEVSIIDANGQYLFPGITDMHVHCREPGFTDRATIYTETQAAAAGGVTSICEMPNTAPPTITQERLEDKYKRAAQNSFVNYAFYPGATTQNIDWLTQLNPQLIPGIKVFLGASTGDLLMDREDIFAELLKRAHVPIMIHAEDNTMIHSNLEHFKRIHGASLNSEYHPLIRSREACLESSANAVQLARKYQAQLHVLHVSTKDEILLFAEHGPNSRNSITAEACIGHLWFDDTFYKTLENKIKVNPAIKTKADRLALLKALHTNQIDVISSDHAPHLLADKELSYSEAPSGMPVIQFGLPAMLEYYHQGMLSLETIVDKMCHAPADILNIADRGEIREGFFADLILVNLQEKWKVSKKHIHSLCQWSPFEGTEFQSAVNYTFRNGEMIYAKGNFPQNDRGMPLTFER